MTREEENLKGRRLWEKRTQIMEYEYEIIWNKKTKRNMETGILGEKWTREQENKDNRKQKNKNTRNITQEAVETKNTRKQGDKRTRKCKIRGKRKQRRLETRKQGKMERMNTRKKLGNNGARE